MRIKMLANLGKSDERWSEPWKDKEERECSKDVGDKLVALNLAVDITPPPPPPAPIPHAHEPVLHPEPVSHPRPGLAEIKPEPKPKVESKPAATEKK